MTVLRRSRRLPCNHGWVHLAGVQPGEPFQKRCGTCKRKYTGRLVPCLLSERGVDAYKIEWGQP